MACWDVGKTVCHPSLGSPMMAMRVRGEGKKGRTRDERFEIEEKER